MERLFGGGMRGQPQQLDGHLYDTAETVYISSLALLKMLKHGKAGIPLEVMGLMLGDYVDDYTVKCIDVFAMPQAGTEASIEAIDEAFQAKMVEMLKQTGRTEIVVGWYHSHPGFGCFLSSVDVNTQKSFEQLNKRFVAVVVDPIQSVRGKVVIDAFRSYGDNLAIGDVEMRQTTSNLGTQNKSKGLGIRDLAKIQYYNLLINYRKNDLETQMLLNLHKSSWDEGFKLKKSEAYKKSTKEQLDKMIDLCSKYSIWIDEEVNKSTQEVNLKVVGKFNPKDHLEHTVEESINDNINQCLTTMINTIIF
jgi:26S proteasome regulatory subunit N11